MKKLLSYLPFHFLMMLILGIGIQFYLELWSASLNWLFCVLVLLLFLKRNWLFSVITGMIFFVLGMFITYQYNDKNDVYYYRQYTNNQNSSVLEITKVLQSNAYADRYEAEVIRVDSVLTVGNVLLNFKSDSLDIGFDIGDRIVIPSNFTEIKPPSNPYQFNYKSYLARQGIHQQVYINQVEFKRLESSSTFWSWIAQLRTHVQTSLKNEGFQKDELGVINALLLGQRKEVSESLLEDYARAGAIHILAISGLHIGIILLILSWVFKPLEIFRHGKFLKLLLIVLALWFFALLAGMSASVVRAVTMFTAVSIGQFLQRKNSVVYSLVFSMFVLLLCKPMFLFDVGFQLSYIAVYGIVTIQPKLVQLWRPRWKLLNKIWQLTTGSVAAQLSILPLSLFYFHQFPSLFWISNIVIIPFLGGILIGGILVIFLSICSFLHDFLVTVYGGVISLMNDFIRLVSHQESFLFSEISFSIWMMIASYLVIIFGYRLFEGRRQARWISFLMSVMLAQGVLFFEKYVRESKSELIVFHQSRKSSVGVRVADRFLVYGDVDAVRGIESYIIGEGVHLKQQQERPTVIRFKDKQVLFVDRMGIYQVKGLKSPVVVLNESPKVNMIRLIDELQPSLIVADGSNYKSIVAMWEKTCLETTTPFWDTRQHGAYILN